MARIPVVVVPTAAIADVGKAVAIVAVIIIVEATVRIAVIIAGAVTVARIAEPQVICATRQSDPCRPQRSNPQQGPAAQFICESGHSKHPFFVGFAPFSIRRISGTLYPAVMIMD